MGPDTLTTTRENQTFSSVTPPWEMVRAPIYESGACSFRVAGVRSVLPRGTVICDTNRGVKMSKPVVKNQKQKKNSVCLCNIKGCSLLKTQHIGHLFYYGIAVLGM